MIMTTTTHQGLFHCFGKGGGESEACSLCQYSQEQRMRLNNPIHTGEKMGECVGLCGFHTGRVIHP